MSLFITDPPDSEYLYRYVDVVSGVFDEYGDLVNKYVSLELKEYLILKKTPKGFWIRLYRLGDDKRFVLDSGRKRFAHKTKELAIDSFLTRKHYQVQHIKKKLNFIEQAVRKAESIKAKVMDVELI